MIICINGPCREAQLAVIQHAFIKIKKAHTFDFDSFFAESSSKHHDATVFETLLYYGMSNPDQLLVLSSGMLDMLAGPFDSDADYAEMYAWASLLFSGSLYSNVHNLAVFHAPGEEGSTVPLDVKRVSNIYSSIGSRMASDPVICKRGCTYRVIFDGPNLTRDFDACLAQLI